ncbi:AaceriABR089Cp [[Ashbya] aceris (nom. inval.)]|nr:AaceriABR089Cp [[Ashbya] aceris (nom. inval.)]
MTSADYTAYLLGAELGQGATVMGLTGAEGLYSNNSLNITAQPADKGMVTPQLVDTPNTLKSSKTQLGTPTAMTDLLAMLDDNTAFSDMVQQQEERQWDVERQRSKFATQAASAVTSGHTTTTTELSPQMLLQSEVGGDSGLLDTGLLDMAHDEHTSLLPLQQSEQQFINPNLLSSGAGSSMFADDGLIDEPVAHGSSSQLIIDEMALSPGQRRMSDVVTGSIPHQQHSRGSISHQVDFWNLSNDRQSICSSQSATYPQRNSIDLMSFKKSPTPNMLSGVSGVNVDSTTPVATSAMGHMTTASSSHSNSATAVGMVAPSVFKIDNELTQLLNDYNINFNAPSKTASTRMRAGSLNPTGSAAPATSASGSNIISSAMVAASRRSNSVSEPHRVQKHRASMSVIDGANPVLMDKLYGDVNKVKPPQWESAVMSDEDDHEERRLSVAQQLDPKSLPGASTFITPTVLDGLDNTSYDMRNPSYVVPTRRKRASVSKASRASKSSSPLEEEEKPFKCQECTKAFRRSEHLKRHIRSVHSSDRPFPCTYCDKKFSRSDNLSQHLKTHRKHGDIKDTPPTTKKG